MENYKFNYDIFWDDKASREFIGMFTVYYNNIIMQFKAANELAKEKINADEKEYFEKLANEHKEKINEINKIFNFIYKKSDDAGKYIEKEEMK